MSLIPMPVHVAAVGPCKNAATYCLSMYYRDNITCGPRQGLKTGKHDKREKTVVLRSEGLNVAQ
jgi:hypothetical protein